MPIHAKKFIPNCNAQGYHFPWVPSMGRQVRGMPQRFLAPLVVKVLSSCT